MEPCIGPQTSTSDADFLAVFEAHLAALNQFFSTKALRDASRCMATAGPLFRAGGLSEKQIKEVELPRLRRALASKVVCISP